VGKSDAPKGFDLVYENIKEDVWLFSTSGTDEQVPEV
jgi:hypothetical protein